MADFDLKVDLRGFDKEMRKFAKDLQSLPRGRKNPLVSWAQKYRRRLYNALGRRPTVDRSGVFRGVRWPKLKPQYTRKADGKTNPVWGGINRLRLGVVTRASGTSIRQLSALDRRSGVRAKEVAAGFGVVKRGQVVGRGGKTLGKLKSDGKRYKKTDVQLGKVKGQTLLGDWLQGDLIMGAGNLSASITSRFRYAARIAKTRPWHWTPRTRRTESKHLTNEVAEYIRKQLRARIRG